MYVIHNDGVVESFVQFIIVNVVVDLVVVPSFQHKIGYQLALSLLVRVDNWL